MTLLLAFIIVFGAIAGAVVLILIIDWLQRVNRTTKKTKELQKRIEELESEQA